MKADPLGFDVTVNRLADLAFSLVEFSSQPQTAGTIRAPVCFLGGYRFVPRQVVNRDCLG